MTKKKDDSLIEGVLSLGAIIGGAWLSVAILNSLTQKRIYKCPNCGYEITKAGVSPCPNPKCNVTLDWK
jgi:hypothetical protein